MLKLLIGYDGSEYSAGAINDLARAGLPAIGVEATVLSIADVFPGVLGEDSYPSLVFKESRLHAQQEMAEAHKIAQEGAQRVGRMYPDWQVRSDAVADSPYWGLIKRADESATDLLVVGSQGRSALGRLMFGSVSHNAVLYATCSTRIGRGREKERPVPVETSTPVRVMIGWDGSAGASAAINAVSSRQWPVGSRAQLVCAIDVRLTTALPLLLPVDPTTPSSTVPQASAPSDPTEILRASANSAGDLLRAARLEVQEPTLRMGDPKRVLVEEADTWSADCVFVGARGLNRVQRILLGSVAAAVAARANCSVEVVRS